MGKTEEGIDKKRLSEKDWADMETEYASSSISYREMAEKYAVSFNTLKERAGKERWTEKRKRYREKYTTNTQQNLARGRARACARDMKNLGSAAGNISAAIRKILRDSKQFKRYIITESVGKGVTETTEQIFDKVDTRALRDIAATMKDLTYVLRDVYGVPRAMEQSAMEIAAARLELDQEKEKKSGGNQEVRLVIVDPTEEEASHE